MAQPSDEERELYPLLTQRPEWPPRRHPEADMQAGERAELVRYWEAQAEQTPPLHWLQAGTGERPVTAAQQVADERPWYEQAREKARSEASLEPVTDKVEPSWPQDSFSQQEQQQLAAYEAELLERATVRWRRTAEEREILELVKHNSPEVQAYFQQRILQKRMEQLREADNAAAWERVQPQVQSGLRERVESLFKREPEQER